MEQSVRVLVSVDRAVENDRRSDAAGTQAARSQKRQLAIAGRFPRADVSRAADGGKQIVGPLHVARGAGANDAGVFSLRLEREKMVKGGDAIDPTERQFQMVSYEMQQSQLQIAEQTLGGVQHFDERVLAELVTFHRHLKQFEPLVAAGMLESRRRLLPSRLHDEKHSLPFLRAEIVEQKKYQTLSPVGHDQNEGFALSFGSWQK
jgi:hypothetical protein